MVFLFRDLTTVSFCNVGFSDPVMCLFTGPVGLLFTLHTSLEHLLYVSETVPFAANANFGTISMPTISGSIHAVCLKLWALRQATGGTLLFDMAIDLDSLVCTTQPWKILDDDKLAANSIVLGFHRVYFYLGNDIMDPQLLGECIPYQQYANLRSGESVTSYSFDDVRCINSLVAGVNDFSLSKAKLASQVAELQQGMDNSTSTSTSTSRSTTPASTSTTTSTTTLTSLKTHLHLLHKFVAKQKMANDELFASVLSKDRQVKALVATLEDDVPSFLNLFIEKLDIVKSEIPPLYEALDFSVYPDLITSLRTAFLVLQEVFPIELTETESAYSIAGIDFPASIQEILSCCYEPKVVTTENGIENSIHKVNAGLNIICSIILYISSIMDLNLKYPIMQEKSNFYLVEYCSLLPKSLKSNSNFIGEFGVEIVKYPLFYDALDSEKVAKLAGPVKSYELRNQKFERALLLLKRNLVALNSDIMELYSKYLHQKIEGTNITGNIPVDCVDNFVWTLNYILLFVTAPHA